MIDQKGIFSNEIKIDQKKIEILVNDWEDNRIKLEKITNEMYNLKSKVHVAINALGKNLIPNDYKAGEIFNFYVNGRFLIIEAKSLDEDDTMQDFKIKWRS